MLFTVRNAQAESSVFSPKKKSRRDRKLIFVMFHIVPKLNKCRRHENRAAALIVVTVTSSQFYL